MSPLSRGTRKVMNEYPDAETYQKLYAKYLKKPVSSLTDLAGDLKGKVVWDLCCGNGEIAMACFSAGASRVVAVDESPEMLRRLTTLDCCGMDDRLEVHCEAVECFMMKRQGKGMLPDVIFCRQAINYWLDEFSAGLLRGTMKNGCQFIFNTFNLSFKRNPLPLGGG